MLCSTLSGMNYFPIFPGLVKWETVAHVIAAFPSTAKWKIKEIVPSQMKMLSVFTNPHVVSNLYDFFCSMEHERLYLKDVGNHTVSVPIYLYYMNTVSIFQNIFLMFCKRQKCIQVGNNMRVNELWQNIHFFVCTIPLNLHNVHIHPWIEEISVKQIS